MEKTEQFYTIGDLSRRWGVQRQSIARQIQTGEIPAFQIGKLWRISRQTVCEIESGRRQSGERAAA